MEVTQNRGLTLCPIDVLSGSDDETPEDLGLSSSLSLHLHVREHSWDISPGGPLVPSPLLEKGQSTKSSSDCGLDHHVWRK